MASSSGDNAASHASLASDAGNVTSNPMASVAEDVPHPDDHYHDEEDPRDASAIAAAAVAAVARRRAAAAAAAANASNGQPGGSLSAASAGGGSLGAGSSGAPGQVGAASTRSLATTLSSIERFDTILARRSSHALTAGSATGHGSSSSSDDDDDDGSEHHGSAAAGAAAAAARRRLMTRRSSKSVSSMMSGASAAARREQLRLAAARANAASAASHGGEGGEAGATGGDASHAATRVNGAEAPVVQRGRSHTVDHVNLQKHHRRRHRHHKRRHRRRARAMGDEHRHIAARAFAATRHRVPKSTRTLKTTLRATQRRLAKLQSKLQVRVTCTTMGGGYRQRQARVLVYHPRLYNLFTGDVCCRSDHVQGVVNKGSRHFYNRPRITVGWEIVQEERKATWFEVRGAAQRLPCCLRSLTLRHCRQTTAILRPCLRGVLHQPR